MSFQQIKDKLNQYTIDIRSSKTNNSLNEMNKIEEENGYHISPDYKSFINECGECWIEENVYTYLKEKPVWLVGESVPVELFYGLEQNDYDIREAIKTYKEQLPEQIIPIADAEGGDLICLDVSEINQGKIYFWDHELRDREQDLFLIADTFTEFIDGLFVVEDEDSDIEDIDIQLSDDLLKMLKERE
ncbi:SMI1/KNR4 family protein [Bacillus pumilus]|uniref:SMI1/KNR4 family protein n=1 Tax=Bacillus pumilus TaxID=1408 RepID=UPI001C23D5FF|nr:SMI1/KNR4 family protein [Bacillus pumilus]MBU8573803.1 SMI1/KNR4 family protein [Bacillus pumilus]